MQNLKLLSNVALLSQIKILVAEERKCTAQVLELLREVDRRRLYAEQGYASLFDYAVQALGYSEGSAARRINSMRLLRDIPEIKESIETGSLQLSAVSSVQSFLKREEREKGKTYTADEKRELLFQMENRSQRQCEKILMGISPDSVRPKERARVISLQETEIRFVASNELLAKIEKLKGFWAHSYPNLNLATLFELLADRALDQLDPVRKHQKASAKKLAKNRGQRPKPAFDPIWPPVTPLLPGSASATALPQKDSAIVTPSQKSTPIVSSTPTSELDHAQTSEFGREAKQSQRTPSPRPSREAPAGRFIPAALRRAVWVRDGGRCTYVAPDTKKPCESTFCLEVDHRRPLALGGRTELTNLRLLCREHNAWEAIQILGHEKMQRYLPTLK